MPLSSFDKSSTHARFKHARGRRRGLSLRAFRKWEDGGRREDTRTHTLQFHSSLSCSRAKFVDSFLHLFFPILFFHELNAPLTPPSLAIFSKCQQWKRIRECSEGERRRRENCYLTLIQFRLTFPSLLSPFDTYPVTEATKKRRRGRTDGEGVSINATPGSKSPSA